MIRRVRGPYRGKRAVDLGIVAAVAVPSLLVGSLCAILVKATSHGPVFFRQERIGMHGRPFQVWKFRTMLDLPDNPIFPDPARITFAGRLLRRASLDELPQLLNVLDGTMSIVGPRPTLAYQVRRYNPVQRRRLMVRPGITGLAQIRGRNSISWVDRIALDLEYLERQSPLFDLSIVVRTLVTVVQGGSGGHPTADPIAMDDVGVPKSGVT